MQLAEIRESRARIVRVGHEERRRLERHLHDGAQQRLLGIGMALQLLRPSADPESQRLLDETLRVTRGNKTLTARLLGIDVRTVSRKLERLDENAESGGTGA